MKAFFLWAAVGVVTFAVAAATFLVIATPTDLLQERLLQQVRKQTGRDLTITGGTSLKFFPSLGIRLHDVSLAQPPGMGGEPMARIAELDATMPVWPLLRGEIKISELVMRRPELNLRIDDAGRRNWDFQPQRDRRRSDRQQSGGDSSSADAQKKEISVANVRIEDGSIHYHDARQNIREEINSLNLGLDIDALDSPLVAQGALVLRGEEISFNGRLSSLDALISGVPSQMTVHLTGRPFEATYDGTISTRSFTRLDGALTVKSGSIRTLAEWVGSSLPDGQKDGPLTLSGEIETTANSVQLKGADAQVAKTKIAGFAVLERRKDARPRLSADLRLSDLDLTTWLAHAGGDPAKPQGRGGASGSGKSAPSPTIDEVLKGTTVDEPQVRGFVARHGWSDAPFNTARLGHADADLKLHIERLSYRDLEMANTQITATIVDQVLDASIDQMQLYKGSGSGNVHLDASNPQAKVSANLKLTDISAFELLQDAAEFDWITGRGNVSLMVVGQGQSELQIVQSLDGKAAFTFDNGALVGVDIPGIIEGLHEGRIPRFERNETDRTGFSELAATFTIKDGIAENRDLKLVSSVVHVTGSGSADLPRRTLDYTMRPKLIAATSPSRESGQKFGAVELPIRITGSWDRPSYSADVAGVIENPEQVVETAKEIGKRFKGKKLKETLRDLLGDGDENDAKETKQKARDLLRQFLKP